MGLLDEIKNYNDLAIEAKERIERVYLDDNRPWVVGYSGGKDSTTALQLIIETLVLMKKKNIKLNKKIYVISSDTMVETPLIISSIANNLEQIQRFVNANHLPVDYSLVIAPVVADLCTTPVALSAPPNSYQNNSQS